MRSRDRVGEHYNYITKHSHCTMLFNTFGNPSHKTLILIHGLGVSYQVFEPLIEHLHARYCIIAVQVDGFSSITKTSPYRPFLQASTTRLTSSCGIFAPHTMDTWMLPTASRWVGALWPSCRSARRSPSTTSSSMLLLWCHCRAGVSTPCAITRVLMCGAATT